MGNCLINRANATKQVIMDFLIYLICLGVGLVFTLVSAIFGHHFGGGHEAHVDGSHGHAEAGADSSDMPGISALSPTVISAFVTSFGGLGVILKQFPATKSPLISAPLATLGGFGIAYALLWFLRQLFSRTQSSSESKISNVVGMTAHVITPIPENGVGEIAYVQSGTRYTAPAREEAGLPISNGRAVKVIRVIGSQFYVIPI
jgi:membrane protein implicated in regulation of membrane protease activity